MSIQVAINLNNEQKVLILEYIENVTTTEDVVERINYIYRLVGGDLFDKEEKTAVHNLKDQGSYELVEFETLTMHSWKEHCIQLSIDEQEYGNPGTALAGTYRKQLLQVVMKLDENCKNEIIELIDESCLYGREMKEYIIDFQNSICNKIGKIVSSFDKITLKMNIDISFKNSKVSPKLSNGNEFVEWIDLKCRHAHIPLVKGLDVSCNPIDNTIIPIRGLNAREKLLDLERFNMKNDFLSMESLYVKYQSNSKNKLNIQELGELDLYQVAFLYDTKHMKANEFLELIMKMSESSRSALRTFMISEKCDKKIIEGIGQCEQFIDEYVDQCELVVEGELVPIVKRCFEKSLQFQHYLTRLLNSYRNELTECSYVKEARKKVRMHDSGSTTSISSGNISSFLSMFPSIDPGTAVVNTVVGFAKAAYDLHKNSVEKKAEKLLAQEEFNDAFIQTKTDALVKSSFELAVLILCNRYRLLIFHIRNNKNGTHKLAKFFVDSIRANLADCMMRSDPSNELEVANTIVDAAIPSKINSPLYKEPYKYFPCIRRGIQLESEFMCEDLIRTVMDRNDKHASFLFALKFFFGEINDSILTKHWHPLKGNLINSYVTNGNRIGKLGDDLDHEPLQDKYACMLINSYKKLEGQDKYVTNSINNKEDYTLLYLKNATMSGLYLHNDSNNKYEGWWVRQKSDMLGLVYDYIVKHTTLETVLSHDTTPKTEPKAEPKTEPKTETSEKKLTNTPLITVVMEPAATLASTAGDDNQSSVATADTTAIHNNKKITIQVYGEHSIPVVQSS